MAIPLNLKEENERLQAIVAKCERDIGLALADYKDSQTQLVQMSEALNAIDNLAAGVVCEKHINCPSCRIMEIAQSCSTASSAEWLEGKLRAAEVEGMRNSAIICDGVAETYPSSGVETEYTEGQVCARRIRFGADALAGEQPAPPEAVTK